MNSSAVLAERKKYGLYFLPPDDEQVASQSVVRHPPQKNQNE